MDDRSNFLSYLKSYKEDFYSNAKFYNYKLPETEEEKKIADALLRAHKGYSFSKFDIRTPYNLLNRHSDMRRGAYSALDLAAKEFGLKMSNILDMAFFEEIEKFFEEETEDETVFVTSSNDPYIYHLYYSKEDYDNNDANYFIVDFYTKSFYSNLFFSEEKENPEIIIKETAGVNRICIDKKMGYPIIKIIDVNKEIESAELYGDLLDIKIKGE